MYYNGPNKIQTSGFVNMVMGCRFPQKAESVLEQPNISDLVLILSFQAYWLLCTPSRSNTNTF